MIKVGSSQAHSPSHSLVERPAPAALSLSSAGPSHRFTVSILRGLSDQEFQKQIDRWINGRSALIVTTPTVDRLYGSQLRDALKTAGPLATWLVVPCDERSKTLRTVEKVCAQAVNARIDRTGVLVSFGGGVCSDVVTLAASLTRRGVSHLRIPTTLVGQIDAGIGLKGGVNFGLRKNHLGCFHPPEAVIVVPSLLNSLSSNNIRHGIAEMIKVSCTSDPLLFELLERKLLAMLETKFQPSEEAAQEAVRRSIAGTLRELERNPFEKYIFERALDFGHTLAHPLEAQTGYMLHHGLAVAIDMAFSCVLAWRLARTSVDVAMRIVGLLLTAGLPIYHHALTEELVLSSLAAAAEHRGGTINLVMPTNLGSFSFLKKADDIPAGLICEVIEWLRRTQDRACVLAGDAASLTKSKTGTAVSQQLVEWCRA